VATQIGAAPNQVVLAWLMRSSPTVVPLIGPRTYEQYEAAMGALDIKLAGHGRRLANAWRALEELDGQA